MLPRRIRAFGRVFNTSSAGKAKSSYLSAVCDIYPDLTYTAIKVKCLGPGITRHEKCKECDYGYPVDYHQDTSQAVTICEQYHVGTEVVYEEVIGLTGEVRTRTRSIAWLVGSTPVVMIEGRAGGCSIDHMKVIQ